MAPRARNRFGHRLTRAIHERLNFRDRIQPHRVWPNLEDELFAAARLDSVHPTQIPRSEQRALHPRLESALYVESG